MRSKVSLPNVIDGVTGSDSIVNMWRSHYNDLFNCIKKDNNVHDLYNNVCYEPDIEVSHADITSGIEGLANNKSSGLDGASAEHLKHSSNRIVPMLAMCFTGFFIHCMLPPSMISVVLVPIVKDKRASVCSRGDRGWLSHGLVVTLPISYSLDGGTLWGFQRGMSIADGTT